MGRINGVTGQDVVADNSTAIDGVTVTGTPSSGQVPTATSSSAATWQTPSGGSGGWPSTIFTAPPSQSTLIWANQGGATATDQYGGLTLTAPASSGDNLRCLFLSAYPSTPFSFTIAMSVNTFLGNYWNTGIVVSDGTKFETFHWADVSGLGFGVIAWSNATTVSSTLAALSNSWLITNNLIWLRVTDNGTNYTFQVSNNGIDFTNSGTSVYSASRTAFLTPTKIGVYVDANNATYGMTNQIVSWKVQ